MPRQETKQLVRVAGFKLLEQTQKNMARCLGGPKDGEVGVLFVLLPDEGWTGQSFMNDAAAVVPTEWTLAIALPKELRAFAC